MVHRRVARMVTRAEKIREGDDVIMAGEFCDAMPGQDCRQCKFRDQETGRCGIMDYLHEEVDE